MRKLNNEMVNDIGVEFEQKSLIANDEIILS